MVRKGKEKKAKPELQLANAMNRLAENLEKLQDPLLWQKAFGDAMQTLAGVPQLQPHIAAALPLGVTVEAITVSLSEEERERMAQRVYEALEPQLQELNTFVKDSLKELPAHRLKEMASQIEAGATGKLQRRRGCVFVELDSGYEAYLGM